MKIIIVGPAYPYRGGIADTNVSLCRALVQRGHDASIITFTVQYPEFLFPGKTQYTTDGSPSGVVISRMINSVNPINWMSTARRINRLNPDLVIVRYWTPFLAPCLGSIVRKLKPKIKSIAMCDNVIPHEKRVADKLFTRYFTEAFDGFMTLSKSTFNELEEFTDLPKRYYPHPIDDSLGERINQLEARRHLNLSSEDRYLLFFGLIRDYKGLDLTLKALNNSQVKSQNIKLLVVGEFYEPREKYDKLIDELNLKDKVIIVNEFVPKAKIKYYFSACDLVIQTYKSASQSGVSQIAFHFEAPILVTNVGGLSEIILHEKVGYVSEKNPDNIAHWILDFFDNNRREDFSKKIQSEKHKYDWKVFADQLILLYQELA